MKKKKRTNNHYTLHLHITTQTGAHAQMYTLIKQLAPSGPKHWFRNLVTVIVNLIPGPGSADFGTSNK